MVGGAGVLDEGRSARRQIAHRPVTEPAPARFDVAALGDAELASRLLDVPAKSVEAAGRVVWIDELPAGISQRDQVVGLALVDQQGEFERLRGLAGQFDEPEKLLALRAVVIALPDDFLPAPLG